MERLSRRTLIIISAVIAFILLLLGIFVYLRNKGDGGGSDDGAGSFAYEGKTLNVVSTDGKIVGVIGIGLDETDESLPVRVAFFLKIDEALPLATSGVGGGYHYIAKHGPKDFVLESGQVDDIYCSHDEFPDPLEMIEQGIMAVTQIYRACLPPEGSYGKTTDLFFNAYIRHASLEDFDYQELLENQLLEIYDTSNFYVSTTDDQGITSWEVDKEQAFSQSPVASYELVVSE